MMSNSTQNYTDESSCYAIWTRNYSPQNSPKIIPRPRRRDTDTNYTNQHIDGYLELDTIASILYENENAFQTRVLNGPKTESESKVEKEFSENDQAIQHSYPTSKNKVQNSTAVERGSRLPPSTRNPKRRLRSRTGSKSKRESRSKVSEMLVTLEKAACHEKIRADHAEALLRGDTFPNYRQVKKRNHVVVNIFQNENGIVNGANSRNRGDSSWESINGEVVQAEHNKSQSNTSVPVPIPPSPDNVHFMDILNNNTANNGQHDVAVLPKARKTVTFLEEVLEYRYKIEKAEIVNVPHPEEYSIRTVIRGPDKPQPRPVIQKQEPVPGKVDRNMNNNLQSSSKGNDTGKESKDKQPLNKKNSNNNGSNEKKDSDKPDKNSDKKRDSDKPDQNSNNKKDSDKPDKNSDKKKDSDKPDKNSDKKNDSDKPDKNSDKKKDSDKPDKNSDKKKNSDKPDKNSDKKKDSSKNSDMKDSSKPDEKADEKNGNPKKPPSPKKSPTPAKGNPSKSKDKKKGDKKSASSQTSPPKEDSKKKCCKCCKCKCCKCCRCSKEACCNKKCLIIWAIFIFASLMALYVAFGNCKGTPFSFKKGIHVTFVIILTYVCIGLVLAQCQFFIYLIKHQVAKPRWKTIAIIVLIVHLIVAAIVACYIVYVERKVLPKTPPNTRPSPIHACVRRCLLFVLILFVLGVVPFIVFMVEFRKVRCTVRPARRRERTRPASAPTPRPQTQASNRNNNDELFPFGKYRRKSMPPSTPTRPRSPTIFVVRFGGN